MSKKNKMGTIYPKKIQEVIHGTYEEPVKIGYTKKEIRRKEGETWVDEKGKEWEMKNGIIQSIPKFQDIRVPLFCPNCNGIMGKRSKDVEVYYKFGFCLNCLIERDSKMIHDGTYEEYQKNYIKSKKVGYYKDMKLQIEEYLKTLEKGYLEYVKEDGTIEKWEGDDINTLKDFWTKELKSINEEMDKLEE